MEMLGKHFNSARPCCVIINFEATHFACSYEIKCLKEDADSLRIQTHNQVLCSFDTAAADC